MSSSETRDACFSQSGHKRLLKKRHSGLGDGNGMRAYTRGSIRRLSVKNFMTFATVSVDLDPQLNVFLAPNGTGKSSLVCALCLGLGGKPTLLARQTRLSEFVRRGEETAFIEILLSGGPGSPDSSIKRILHAEKEASEWNLDGCPVTLKDVEAFVKSMNIQLDNLLQFMPQDRVSEFASLSPIRLLEETERAVNPDLQKTHQSLVALSKKLSTTNQKTRNLENDLKRATGLMKGLERDVDRIRQVIELTKEANQIDAKLLILSIEQKKDDLKTATEHMQAGEKDIQAKQRQLRTLSEQLIASRKTKEQQQSECERAKAVIVEKESLNIELSDGNARREDLIEDKIMELQDLSAESIRQREKIEALKERVAAIEEEIRNDPGYPEEKETLSKELGAKCKDCTEKMQAMQRDIDGLRHQQSRLIQTGQQVQGQIDRLDNINIRLVQSLEKQRPLFRGLLQAYETLKQHTDRFEMPVIGPVITEVAVRDPMIASYLESQVPLATWTLFIVQCDADLETLRSLQLMRELNVIKFKPSEEGRDSYVDDQRRLSLSQFGVTGCLKDLFEAQTIVKEVLDGECNLSRTFVGTEETSRHVSALFDADRTITRLYTPRRCYTCTKSRYSSSSSVGTTETRQPRLLGQSPAIAEERPELEKQIFQLGKECEKAKEDEQKKQEELEALRESYSDAKNQFDELAREKKDLEWRRMTSTRRLQEAEKELNRVQSLPDPLLMEIERKDEIQSLQNDMLQTIRKMRQSLSDQCRLHKSLCCKQLQLIEAEKQCETIETKTSAMSRKVDEQKRLVAQLKDVMRVDRQCLQDSEEELRAEFPEVDEWTAVLESLPSDRSELEDMTSEKRYKAKTMTCNNPDALASYDTLQAEVNTLKSELEGNKALYIQKKSEVDHMKTAWLRDLKTSILRINEAFMDSFLAIGCIGQVELSGEETHGNEFQSYALEIKVKFRAEEPLKVLDSMRQSGGERVVATTLYLLSLQAVSHIPFRVMDEINHGMDEENERRVMDILASHVGSGCMPQTFLLTPKMFSNPDFLKLATTHLIANGLVYRE